MATRHILRASAVEDDVENDVEQEFDEGMDDGEDGLEAELADEFEPESEEEEEEEDVEDELEVDGEHDDDELEAPQIAVWGAGRLEQLPIESIVPDPDQPRTEFDDDQLESIRAQGVLEPVVVRRNPTPGSLVPWMLINGETRWRAARSLGHATIPARVQEVHGDAGDILLKQLTYNTGKPLRPIDEARAWARLLALKGWTVQQLAAALGLPKSLVGDRLAILNAPAPFQPLFQSGVLTPSAAPIVRKFSSFPESFLAAMVTHLLGDAWEGWKAQADSGVAVPVSHVERDLEGAVFRVGATNVGGSPAMKTFGGQLAKVGKKTYAVDAEAWYTHVRAFNARPAATERTENARANANHRADDYEATRKREAELRRKKNALLQAKFATVATKVPVARALTPAFAGLLVDWVLRANHYNQDTLKAVCVALGIRATPEEQQKKVGFETLIRRHAKTVDGLQLTLQLLMARDLGEAAWAYGPVKLERITAAAKLLKIDLKKVVPLDDRNATVTPAPNAATKPAKKPAAKPVAKKAIEKAVKKVAPKAAKKAAKKKSMRKSTSKPSNSTSTKKRR